MKALLKLSVIVVVVWAANAAGAAVINFDDLGPVIGVPDPENPDSGIDYVPAGYAGFMWDQVGVIHKNYFSSAFGSPGTGYEYGTVSGDYAAFNVYAEAATVT